MSLVLVHKHHIVTYNIQYGKEFAVHIPQLTIFKMTNSGLFCHDMRQLLKNKNNAHTMVNNSRSPIPQVDEKKKQYIACDVNRDYHVR